MRKAYSYIRMSTSVQLKGDSLRRQLELSKSYALANGLELIDSVNGILLNDIGISAFKSDNSKIGTLGLFISALQAKKIPENSVLLIESLDRLSRDKVTEALMQFIQILQFGIEIVTLNDNQSYTKDNINESPGKLFVTLGSMIRANEESETKSKRLLAAWTNKRAQASTKILTKICPAWLMYDDVTSKFVVIDNKVKIIKLIFDMCINTSGLYAITKYLNSNNVPVFGKGKLWYRSYVKKIINNRAVLGEYQPFTKRNGVRESACNLVEFYYPKVIDDKVFKLAQSAIDRRTKNNKGRKGLNYSNIFSGLVYCGLCGYKMVLRNRGATSKGGKYLCCSNNQLSGGCTMGEWKLKSLEECLFKHFLEVNFQELFTDNQNVKNNLLSKLELTKIELATLRHTYIRIQELLIRTDLDDENKKSFIQELNNTLMEIQKLNTEIFNINKQLESENDARNLINSNELKDLIYKLNNSPEDYLFRSSVNQLLARQIEKIELQEEHFLFHPWEYDEESSEIVNFRYKSKSSKGLEDIVSSKEFEAYCKSLTKRALIKYKTGSLRLALLENDYSLIDSRQKLKAKRNDSIIK